MTSYFSMWGREDTRCVGFVVDAGMWTMRCPRLDLHVCLKSVTRLRALMWSIVWMREMPLG